MKAVLSLVPPDWSAPDLLAPVGPFEGILPEGGRESEVRMESPMFGGRDALKKKEEKKERKNSNVKNEKFS